MINAAAYTTGSARRHNWEAKRLFDLAFVFLCLPFVVVTALILLVVNPYLNPGPLLFAQERVGLGGHTFTMWKFRSMVGQANRAAFVSDEGNRLWAFGRVMRKWHLDELPQVLNVLLGDMSFVGPRPEQTAFAGHYARALHTYSHRHDVRPGVTGLAQLRRGYTDDLAGTRHKLRWDLVYISHQSLAFDLYLIWKTVVLLAHGRRNSN